MTQKTPLSLADYKAKVGTELGVSEWIHVTQDRINQFADVTNDHQFIHVNEELAKQTPFGGTIAHGLLTLSFLPAFAYDALPSIEGTQMGVNYGYNKIRFLSPVKSGKRVRGRFTLKEVTEPKPGQVMSITDVAVEIEGENKPALLAEWVTLAFIG
jgi:acyl dehydratase